MFENIFQPWKLTTLAIGIAILIAGSFYEQLPDWDIGLSIIMAVLTYLTAPFLIRTLYRRHYKLIPLALFLAWFSIDGVYCLYNEILGHVYFREANAPASTTLYLLMGFFWLWDRSIKELLNSIISLKHK